MTDETREQELFEMKAVLKRVEEFMEESIERQKRHDPFIEEMMKREAAQDELYKSIKGKVIGTGVISVFSLIGLILWYGIKAWLFGSPH